MEKENRLDWIDILKGIGIIFVILGHGILQNPYAWKMVWSVHMPLFFFATGLVYKKRNLSEQIKRDIKKLLVPYIGGVICVFIGNIIYNIVTNTEFAIVPIILDYIGKLIYGSGGYPLVLLNGKLVFSQIGALWFVCSLFCAKIILNFFLDINKEFQPWIVAGSAYVGLKFTELISVEKLVWLPFSFQAALSGVVFMYVGYLLLQEKCFEPASGRKKCIWVIASLGIWIFVIYRCNGIIMVNNEFDYGLLDFIGGICGCICISEFSKVLNLYTKYLKKFLIFCGRNTFIILIFHLIELNYINWENALTSVGVVMFSEIIREIILLGIKLIWCLSFSILWKFIRRQFSLYWSSINK